MTGAEETKGYILRIMNEDIRKLDCEGGTHGKLQEQRITTVEDTLSEIKQGIKDIDTKLDGYFSANEKWKLIATIIALVIIFVVGGNVWEGVRLLFIR